jgi:hypothetical protein
VIVARHVIGKLAGNDYIDQYMEYARTFYYELENSMNSRATTYMVDGGNFFGTIWPLRASFPYLEWLCLATYLTASHFMDHKRSPIDEQLLIYVAFNRRF